ncbi:MAG: ThuA domain-containing protein [Armatimonadetes bacterium]|nr:ThuA domain-containing protein [Armatimonadota bacterium]
MRIAVRGGTIASLRADRSLLALALLTGGVTLAALVCLLSSPAAFVDEPTGHRPLAAVQDVRGRATKHVLVVSHAAGFGHSSIPLGTQIIQELGQKQGLWETDVAVDAAAVTQKLAGEFLKGVDLVIFNNATGELPISEEGKAAFLQWLRAGHGFVGVHAATDTFYKWGDYGKMIGGYFDGHPWHQKVTVRVEDKKFPGVQSLGDSFEITDEIYQFRDWTRDNLHVILSIDNASLDVTKGKRADNDYAVAWARMEGKGRVFYTSLGHREDVWTDPRYQEHLLGGIRWALGLARAKVKPGTRPGAAEK